MVCVWGMENTGMQPYLAPDRFCWGIVALLIAPVVAGASAAAESVASPDGHVSISMENEGNPARIVSPVNDAHELDFESSTVSGLCTDIGYDLPMVCATSSGRTHFAITQAHLDGYAGASLWREEDALRVRLSTVPKRTGATLVSQSGLTTSWRVVMMSDRAGEMIAAHLIGNLNPAPSGAFSGVKSGKVAWDWWSWPLAGVMVEFYQRIAGATDKRMTPQHNLMLPYTRMLAGPSPLQMVSDDPEAYRDAPGFDVIQRLPTVWKDGATANDFRRSEREVTSRDVLTLQLAPAGGAVVMLEREK